MLGGKALDKKSVHCTILLVQLESVSWMAVEEEGSAHRGAQQPHVPLLTVIRIMKAWILEPHSRAPETAWPCRHSMLQ